MSGTSHERGPIFVVGSSRSGTTMMGRILGNHPDVFTFRELHFFEELWSPETRTVDEAEGVALLGTLLSRQRRGYLQGDRPAEFEDEARVLWAEESGSCPGRTGRLALFERFLRHEARRADKHVPCDQTPRNAYYVGELLAAFPRARVVAMVRDPRSVLLSQKNKWKRRFLGARRIPLGEALRSWVNYHPFTITRLWLASTRRALEHAGGERVRVVRFEDLVADPDGVVRGLCDFLGLAFTPAMLAVPRVGSSVRADDPEAEGIDPARAAGHREGGLRRAEILLCQRTAGEVAVRLGYAPEPGRLPWIAGLGYALLLPLKTGAALLLNLKRMRNVRETLKRRLG